MSVTNRAGHQARTGRDDSHAQNSSGTTCDGCDQLDADGINVDGRSLCRPCARNAETLVTEFQNRREQAAILADEYAEMGHETLAEQYAGRAVGFADARAVIRHEREGDADE